MDMEDVNLEDTKVSNSEDTSRENNSEDSSMDVTKDISNEIVLPDLEIRVKELEAANALKDKTIDDKTKLLAR